MINSNLKIGLFGIGLDVYWDQFEGLKANLEANLETLHQKLEDLPVKIVNAGLVDTVDRAFEAGKVFKREDVGLIFLFKN